MPDTKGNQKTSLGQESKGSSEKDMTSEVSLKGWVRRRYLEKGHKSISQRKYRVRRMQDPVRN